MLIELEATKLSHLLFANTTKTNIIKVFSKTNKYDGKKGKKKLLFTRKSAKPVFNMRIHYPDTSTVHFY